MGKTILTKTLRDGRTATVTIDRSATGTVSVTSWRGAERLGNHCGPHHSRPGMPEGYVAAIGKLCLTADEAATVEAAYREFCAALSPDLHAQRHALAAAVLEAEDRWTDTRATEWDNFDGSGNPFRHDPANEQRIKAAQGALAQFDAEHPEIKAELDAQHDRNVQRWAAL